MNEYFLPKFEEKIIPEISAADCQFPPFPCQNKFASSKGPIRKEKGLHCVCDPWLVGLCTVVRSWREGSGPTELQEIINLGSWSQSNYQGLAPYPTLPYLARSTGSGIRTDWKHAWGILYIVGWEPEGHWCCSTMFRWEPEEQLSPSGRHNPSWFSMEHVWTVLTPFWLSTGD